MLTLKRSRNAAVTVSDIEWMHRMRKDQLNLINLRLRGTAAPAVSTAVLSAKRSSISTPLFACTQNFRTGTVRTSVTVVLGCAGFFDKFYASMNLRTSARDIAKNTPCPALGDQYRRLRHGFLISAPRHCAPPRTPAANRAAFITMNMYSRPRFARRSGGPSRRRGRRII
jgi:hypothetical protein